MSSLSFSPNFSYQIKKGIAFRLPPPNYLLEKFDKDRYILMKNQSLGSYKALLGFHEN